MQEPIKKLLTTEEIAEFLQVHVKTVREWIASGELDAFDLGQGYRVDERDLITFLDKRKRRHPRRKKPEQQQTRQFKFSRLLVWNESDQSASREQQP